MSCQRLCTVSTVEAFNCGTAHTIQNRTGGQKKIKTSKHSESPLCTSSRGSDLLGLSGLSLATTSPLPYFLGLRCLRCVLCLCFLRCLRCLSFLLYLLCVLCVLCVLCLPRKWSMRAERVCHLRGLPERLSAAAREVGNEQRRGSSYNKRDNRTRHPRQMRSVRPLSVVRLRPAPVRSERHQ